MKKAALALAGPAGVGVAGAEAAGEAFERFWRALLDAAGKEAIGVEVVRSGRRVVTETHRAFGFERTIVHPRAPDPEKPVDRRSVSVPRWIAAVGIVGAVVLASSTSKGSGYVSTAKGYFPNLPAVPSLSSLTGSSSGSTPGWNGWVPNSKGWGFLSWGG